MKRSRATGALRPSPDGERAVGRAAGAPATVTAGGRKLRDTMTIPAASPAPSYRRYFFEKFGITERLLERCLGEALSAGGDYADLYFESVFACSVASAPATPTPTI